MFRRKYSSFLADSDIDCHGDCFGTAFIDGCGDCVEGNTGLEECQNDCNGDLGGTAFYDDCLVFAPEGNTGNILALQQGYVYKIHCLEISTWGLYPDLDCNCDCLDFRKLLLMIVVFVQVVYLEMHLSSGCSGVVFGTAEIGSYCLDFDGDGLGLPSSNIDLCNTDIVEVVLVKIVMLIVQI